jgi:hypothetical protein
MDEKENKKQRHRCLDGKARHCWRIWEGGRREKERRRTERKEIFKAGRAGNRESGKRKFCRR